MGVGWDGRGKRGGMWEGGDRRGLEWERPLLRHATAFAALASLELRNGIFAQGDVQLFVITGGGCRDGRKSR